MKQQILGLTAIALMVVAGCQGGVCSNCGAGYNGGGYAPAGFQQPAATWTQPQGTVVQPPAGTIVQPGITTQQPGVVVPVAPVQSQPGTIYGGSGTR